MNSKKKFNLISLWKKGWSSFKNPNPTGIQEISLNRFKALDSKYLLSSTKGCSTGTCLRYER